MSLENNYSVIFLAAGYGTRLQEGINSSNNPKYDALKGLPKPLLPLFGFICYKFHLNLTTIVIRLSTNT